MALIEGMEELLEQFRQLDLVLQRKALIAAARAGGIIVRDAAQQKAPRDTGAMAKSIVVRAVSAESDIHEGVVNVGPTEFYGRFQEHGTVHHRAQPFLAPAFDENEQFVGEAIAQTLAEAIDDTLK
jgi:HK97 gp10 family phage protein